MSNPKYCEGRLKKVWDQLDSKTPAVNLEEVKHEEEMKMSMISSILMRTFTLSWKKIPNVPIVCTYPSRRWKCNEGSI